MREKRITYLFGAGASKDALPLVRKFEIEINSILDSIHVLRQAAQIDYNAQKGGSHSTIFEKKLELIDFSIMDLKFLLNGCNAHQSVDTFAKMFFLTEQMNEYERVKRAIVLFFDLIFLFQRRIDKRYDAFLASILNVKSPRFPQNINVISWNYDYEFEKAFKKYRLKEETLEACYEELNVIHKNSSSTALQHDYCKVIKINGTTGYYSKDNQIKLGLGVDLMKNNEEEYKITLNKLIPVLENHFEKSKENFSCAISFAWEEDKSKTIEMAQKVMIMTTTLVVVGYSFPFFNRKIDKALLSYDCSRYLENIYVQDINPENIIETIKSYRKESEWNSVKFHPMKNIDQFHIPFEF